MVVMQQNTQQIPQLAKVENWLQTTTNQQQPPVQQIDTTTRQPLPSGGKEESPMPAAASFQYDNIEEHATVKEHQHVVGADDAAQHQKCRAVIQQLERTNNELQKRMNSLQVWGLRDENPMYPTCKLCPCFLHTQAQLQDAEQKLSVADEKLREGKELVAAVRSIEGHSERHNHVIQSS